MRKGTKDFFKLLAIFAGLALCAFLFLITVTWTSNPKVEKNVDSVEWLPSTASKTSYIERTGMGGLKIAEFSITQDDFEAFAKDNEWVLKEEENVSIHFRDYITTDETAAQRPFEENILERALVYENRHSNGGGITLVYDPNLSMGYYSYSHR